MKRSKVTSHCKIEITQSPPFIPYELAHNYNYGYARYIMFLITKDQSQGFKPKVVRNKVSSSLW